MSDFTSLRCAFCRSLNRIDLAKARTGPRCENCSRPILIDRPVKVETEDFEATVLEAGVPVLADFYADWCGPCKLVVPLLDEIAASERGRLLVVKIDSDRSVDQCQRYAIRSVPTILLFRDGEEVGRSLGFEPDVIRGFVADAVGAEASP
ncbi:MAG: thioredoxin domain-containing protein [Gammaproteobacteria bacterium]|nr:thioredoxin domain-containing protein [Gammaproteobacteria bacterium]